MTYTITFSSIDFDVENLKMKAELNHKYGNKTVSVDADREDDAMSYAFDKITNMSGYCVNSTAYFISES